MDVLLIDDDEDTIFLVGALFERCEAVKNYFIRSRPKEALELLNRTMPDCIFVDLKMPEMDGFEFIEHFEQLIEKQPMERHRPQVYVLSSSAHQSEHDRAKSYHSVKEFILKPLTIPKLIQISKQMGY